MPPERIFHGAVAVGGSAAERIYVLAHLIGFLCFGLFGGIGYDFGEIRDGRKFGQHGVKQGEPVPAHGGVGGVHQNFVEKQIDFGAQRGDLLEAAAVIGQRPAGFAHGYESLVEFGFGTGFEQSFVEQGVAQPSNWACFRMLRMRLKLAASGSKSSVGRTARSGFEAFFDIEEIVPAGGEDRVDFVVLEAANFAEVVADSFGEEFFELAIAFAESLDRQAQFAFDQDLDDALRGAAQREGVFRAGRDQAYAEASAQRVELVGDRDQLASRRFAESNPPC